jgi:hypothetical protein
MTEAQRRMLSLLARWGRIESEKHGPDNDWLQVSELVMEQAACYHDALAWRRADRTFGALRRRGLVEYCAENDDLVRVSAAGRAELSQ